MNTMPVAPEKLLTMFSLAQVAQMIVEHEDALLGYESADDLEMSYDFESYDTIGEGAATIRVAA